jgi:hypothetical protein
VVVDHAGCLHEGVADRRAEEFESASQQIAAHGVGFSGARWHLSQGVPTILDWRAADEAPEISIETSEFFLHLEEPFRVLDCRCDFQSVPHDPIVAEQPLNVALAVAGDLVRAKSIERFSVVLAFLQNRIPAQSGLRAFQNEKLEEHSIVMYRNAPFLIVISNGRFSRGPGTTRHNVERLHHSASCSHDPVGRSRIANFLEPATGRWLQQWREQLAATSIRFELWLLRRNFFVSAFGAHIVTEVANAGLCDDQFAAGEF